MAMEFTYTFSNDYSVINATRTDDGTFAGAMDIANGEWIGKRGRSISTRPTPFNYANGKLLKRTALSEPQFLIGKLIVQAHHEALLQWFKSNPDFYKFVGSIINIEESNAWYTSITKFYEQFKALGKTTVEAEDVNYIRFLRKNIYGIDSIYANVYPFKETVMSLSDHPMMSKFVLDKLSMANLLPSTCTINSPSVEWYLSIAQTIINDGLDESCDFENMMAGYDIKEILNSDRYARLIEDYYRCLVEIGEYKEDPISEGFFIDYARVRTIKAALLEDKIQGLLDKRWVDADEVALDNYVFTPIKETKDLRHIIQLLGRHFYEEIKDFLNAGKLIIAVTKDGYDCAPFVVDKTGTGYTKFSGSTLEDEACIKFMEWLAQERA